jgi:hypothetical protein
MYRGEKMNFLRKLFSFLFIYISVIPAFGYNRSQVARYADKWWNSRNPFFKNYSADCANYVSQCLIAGGIDLSTDPNCDNCLMTPHNNHFLCNP